MTHNERLLKLNGLGWHQDIDSGQHQICAEHCVWIAGKIAGVDWSAWLSEVSGMVYLHAAPAIDLAFDAFCEVVINGWPEKKADRDDRRSLFGDDDEID